MRRWRALILALVIAALPRPSFGFVLDLDSVGNVLHWVLGGSTAVPYRIAAGNIPYGSEGENAIHRAFATWSATSSNLEYRFDGYANNASMANDGHNVVLFIYDNWPFDEGFAAITFRYYDNRSGRLLDTDIAFNAERYAWSIGGSEFDIENSATHEVGHFSGLGHSAVEEATMFSKTIRGETSKRTLHSDDRAGISAIYGAGGSSAPSTDGGAISSGGGGGGGGCETGPSAGDALFAGFASLLFAATRFLRRRRLLLPAAR